MTSSVADQWQKGIQVLQRKIAVVTFVNDLNFGCVLQRFALETLLTTQFDACVETISYRPPTPVEPFGLRDQLVLLAQGRLRRYERLLARRLRARRDRVVERIFDKNRVRIALFDEFVARRLHSTEPIDSYADLAALRDRYDVFIAGSDQIWNKELLNTEEHWRYFTLDFAPAHKKASYAAGASVAKISGEFEERYRRFLADFDPPIVRENESARELARVLGRPVEVALDPTLTIDVERWSELARDARPGVCPSEPYILCYALDNLKSIVAKARAVQKLVSGKIVCFVENYSQFLFVKARFSDVEPILAAGPTEFVALIERAAAVVTDSLHGSIFSILFRRPFFTMLRDRGKYAAPTRSSNSRFATLTSTFGLEDRIFEPDAPLDETPDRLEIDYERVDAILRERRERSLNLLQKTIGRILGANE